MWIVMPGPDRAANETNASGVIAGSDITFNGGLCLFIPGI
jgi:hypothetical protein